MKKISSNIIQLPLALALFVGISTNVMAEANDTDSLPTGHYKQLVSSINENFGNMNSMVADTDSLPASHFGKIVSAIDEGFTNGTMMVADTDSLSTDHFKKIVSAINESTSTNKGLTLVASLDKKHLQIAQLSDF